MKKRKRREREHDGEKKGGGRETCTCTSVLIINHVVDVHAVYNNVAHSMVTAV